MANLDAIAFNVSCFIAGLFLLEYGADKFVDHTAVVAKRLHVSPTLVGLLTCGGEWEELVVIIVSLGQKKSSMALGNLMGASIANIIGSFSLGLFFIRSAVFDRSSKIYATALMVLTSVFLFFLFALNASLKRAAGILLMAGFGGYIASVASLIYRGTLTAPESESDDASDSDSDDERSKDNAGGSGGNSEQENRFNSDSTSDGTDEEVGGQARSSVSLATKRRLVHSPTTKGPKKLGPPSSTKSLRLTRPRWRKSLSFHVLWLLIGFAALIVSSYVIAHSAAALGHELGLSGTVVGTTILSIATTLPEKCVAIVGGVRKQPGIMVANTVGSNIFLLTLCAGVLFFWGDADEIDFGFTIFEALVMWLSAATVLAIVWFGGKRWMGCILLCCYITFLIIEIMNGRSLDDD